MFYQSFLTFPQVNIIEDGNRFVMVFDNENPQDIVGRLEEIRKKIQDASGHAVIIETVRTKLVQDGASLAFADVG